MIVRFRDPSLFFELLDSAAPGRVAPIVSTSYLPANTKEAGAPEQVIRVERLAMPPPDERLRSARMLDVMEIQVHICLTLTLTLTAPRSFLTFCHLSYFCVALLLLTLTLTLHIHLPLPSSSKKNGLRARVVVRRSACR